MRFIQTIILILLFTLSGVSQVMKPVTNDSADLRICIVSDSTKADIIIFIVKIRSAIRNNPCYWLITRGKRYDYTYKVVPYDEPHDFTIYVTNCSQCVYIRSEFLREGIKKYKLKN